MEMTKLIETANKPEIYTKGTAVMWVDEHIATQLLDIHLNPEIELASRKETTICKTIEWILSKVPGKKLNILDLGCGPGLYTEKLAEKGHGVTGMDFSNTAICYAGESANKKNLKISYLEQDYLALEAENAYDLILMIFTDFGVLLPDERERLLTRIYRALKPGGKFIFDVLNENFPVKKSGSATWEVSRKGFWRNSPYLALAKTFYYDAQDVILNQHIIVDVTGKMDVYRFWIHRFGHGDLKRELAVKNFCTIECYDHVLPGCDLCGSEDLTFCIATK